MKRSIKTICILICLCNLLFMGCTMELEEVSRVSVGKIISVSTLPGSFSEDPRTVVETERGVYIFRGLFSIRKGIRAWEVICSDGQTYFMWENSDTLHRIRK